LILSIGHGGQPPREVYDTGAIVGKSIEHIECVTIVAEIAKRLATEGVGVMIAPDNRLPATVNYINAFTRQLPEVNIFAVEIHRDAIPPPIIYQPSTMSRRMGVIYSEFSKQSERKANLITENFKKLDAHATSWSRSDANRNGLAFVRDTRCEAFIVECGFLNENLTNEDLHFYANTVAQSLIDVLKL
jgi:N-acetylmuramoyl-L-alanine amidase